VLDFVYGRVTGSVKGIKENLTRFFKRNAMFLNVGLSLLFIPLKFSPPASCK
jgi:hypothetical protein